MPSADAILYSLIAGILAVLVAIVGYLFDKGANKLIEELKGLRDDLKIYIERLIKVETKVSDCPSCNNWKA